MKSLCMFQRTTRIYTRVYGWNFLLEGVFFDFNFPRMGPNPSIFKILLYCTKIVHGVSLQIRRTIVSKIKSRNSFQKLTCAWPIRIWFRKVFSSYNIMQRSCFVSSTRTPLHGHVFIASFRFQFPANGAKSFHL
jgi:hypothetical protein